MLSDLQIDRYSRQIILPGVGGGGQARLLGSSVSLYGRGEAIALCASYLAGAGIGTLAVHPHEDGVAAIVARRNPDCRVVSEAAEATVLVAFGDCLPDRAPSCEVVWGDADAVTLRIARFAAGRCCVACLGSLANGNRAAENAGLVSTLVALETLRVLLGLAPRAGAILVSIDLAHGATSTSPFPARPDCALCRSET